MHVITVTSNGRYGVSNSHDDVIKWKHLPHYWPFVRGIHRLPVNSPHKDQWRGALICARTSSWCLLWSALNKQLDKQSTRRCFETPPRSLCRYYNDNSAHKLLKQSCAKTPLALGLHMSFLGCTENRDGYHGGCHSNGFVQPCNNSSPLPTLIARFMGPTWDSSGADRTRVGTMLAPWILLCGKDMFVVNFLPFRQFVLLLWV